MLLPVPRFHKSLHAAAYGPECKGIPVGTFPNAARFGPRGRVFPDGRKGTASTENPNGLATGGFQAPVPCKVQHPAPPALRSARCLAVPWRSSLGVQRGAKSRMRRGGRRTAAAFCSRGVLAFVRRNLSSDDAGRSANV